MRRSIRFGLLLCILLHATAPSAARGPARIAEISPPGAAAPDGGIQQLPAIPSGVYPYYQTLKQYTFDNAGAPDAQGWTTNDLTTQSGTYWHVDDFAGLAGYAPLGGTKSMWCGVRPGVVTDPAFANAPGYGDNWTQILRFPLFGNPYGSSVVLKVRMSYDMPDDEDRLDVEYSCPVGSGTWYPLGTFTGTAAATDYEFNFTPCTPQFEIRFVMTSDWIFSDESAGVNSNGAVVLDNFALTDALTSLPIYVQNFESYAVGTTNGGSWVAETPSPFGNYAGLVNGSGVVQTGTPDNTYMWSFFNGSSATWACGGYPGQAAVPYTSVPGSTRSGDFLHNDTRSPWIDLSVDTNNQPVDPNMGSVCADLDVHNILPTTAWVAFGTRWRFMVNGVVQPWQYGNLWYGTTGWTAWTTLRDVAPAIPPGATHAQLSLMVVDYAYLNGAAVPCHTQSPLFDNVRVHRLFKPVLVFTSNDSGFGSLRQAITDANASPDFNSILFRIGGSPSPYSINVSSPLPPITNPVWIDGFSQPGSSPNTQQGPTNNAIMKVMLHGADAGAGANGLQFSPGSVGVVRGLIISAFSGAGILSQCNSLEIQGCWFGMDHTGTQSFGNGIAIHAAAPGIGIGGGHNEERVLIGASTGDGIRIDAGGALIFNTHCGYDPQGNAMPNGGASMHVTGGTNTQIGQPTYAPCVTGYTDRNRIGAGGYDAGIIVDTAASGVNIYQPWLEGMLDLGNDGPNPNDPLDADSGANGLQNHPVLTGADGTTITGNMDGLPNTLHHIEFFAGAPYYATPTYLGYQDVTTDGSGHAGISFTCSPIPPASSITATATANNNTSELASWALSSNTPPGAPLVNLYDSSNTLRASVQFSSVTGAGNTFITSASPEAPDPQVWTSGAAWDITTNAPHTGGMDVYVHYDPNSIPGAEGSLRLLHLEAGTWTDVTTAVDQAGNRVGGHVNSLSPFIIAVRTGATGVDDTRVPTSFALHANVPNPFNPVTTIDYDVPAAGADVAITIFDVNGRRVRTLWSGHRNGGRYQAQWNGQDDRGGQVASGVYFYRMRAGSFNETRKMVLLK